MANVNVSWALPVTRESGKPLDPADISHVRIEVSADAGETFALVNDFPSDVLQTVVEGLDPGTWVFRGLVADVKGRVSAPVVTSITIEDTTAPGELLNLTIELA